MTLTKLVAYFKDRAKKDKEHGCFNSGWTWEAAADDLQRAIEEPHSIIPCTAKELTDVYAKLVEANKTIAEQRICINNIMTWKMDAPQPAKCTEGELVNRVFETVDAYYRGERARGDQRCAAINAQYLQMLIEIRKHLYKLPRFTVTFAGERIEGIPDSLNRDKVLAVLDHWISVYKPAEEKL